MSKSTGILSLLLVGIFLFFWGCTPNPNTSSAGPNKFSNSAIKAIYELKDKRDARAVMTYLTDQDPIIREEAAMALGSIQDSLAIEGLARLLKDDNKEVRRAAAWALGQSFHPLAELPLLNALEVEANPLVLRDMLEALGKCVSYKNLVYLNRIQPIDSLAAEGQAWGIYRAGIRGVHDGTSIAQAAVLLDEAQSSATRLAAAHFFARSRGLDLLSVERPLTRAALTDSSPLVRMAAAQALAKIRVDGTVATLLKILRSEDDYRVKINALNALRGFRYEQYSDVLWETLDSNHPHVTYQAANLIASNAMVEDGVRLLQAAQNHPHTRAKATLFGAALRAHPKTREVADNIKAAFLSATDPYFKADLLSVLSNDIANSYEFVAEHTFETSHHAIQTAGIGALVTMRSKSSFPEELEREFDEYLKKAVLTADAGMLDMVCRLLANPNFPFKKVFSGDDFLYQAKAKLQLPRDNEALQAIQKAIDYFEGSLQETPVVNTYNHPIDWELIESLDTRPRVAMATTKGIITIELLLEDAPGTVANFIHLAREGYYADKFFHRVVPNFVAQGGCHRGDGYGGEDYSIRSEFSYAKFKEGAVGMASAGKDTEGTQWFITHSPAPHLDGRYTVFAHVIKGMEIVHQLDVGDQILSVELINNK
jgi:cyclophilin family peptidyl-prolyl cis-trans isomerase/HEAT repeat protein